MNTMYVHRLTKEEQELLLKALGRTDKLNLALLSDPAPHMDVEKLLADWVGLRPLIEKLEHPEIRMK